MLRRVAPWFGVLTLGLAAAYLAAFGRAALTTPTAAIVIGGFVVAGLLSIVGGTLESITIGSRTIPWNAFVGAAECVVALAVVVAGLQSIVAGGSGTDATLVAAGSVVGGASLGWMGINIALDTRHADLEATPSRRRLVAIAALAIGSIGFGALLTVVI